jgi:hypothetical protein
MAASGAMAILALVWQVEVEVPMVVDPLEVVELPWVVV